MPEGCTIEENKAKHITHEVANQPQNSLKEKIVDNEKEVVIE
jgi:hypothetical protein